MVSSVAFLQIAVQVQEAAHFAANCHLPLGRTLAKKTLLEVSGYVVLEVAFFQWATCKSAEQQQRLLSGLLGAIHPSELTPNPRGSALASMYSSPAQTPACSPFPSRMLASSAFPLDSPGSSPLGYSTGFPPCSDIPSDASVFSMENLSHSLQ